MSIKKTFVLSGVFLLLLPAALAQKPIKQETIQCRVMETFVAKTLGTSVVIFHQRDKAGGPRLREPPLAHSGEEMEFETRDGRRHHAIILRLKSCFGRGQLLFDANKAELAERDDFVWRFPPNS